VALRKPHGSTADVSSGANLHIGHHAPVIRSADDEFTGTIPQGQVRGCAVIGLLCMLLLFSLRGAHATVRGQCIASFPIVI
jgi:hypothetical protein